MIDERTADLNPKHVEYVAKGYCSSVSTVNSWCCQPDGHAGQHWSLHVREDKTFLTYPLWD